VARFHANGCLALQVVIQLHASTVAKILLAFHIIADIVFWAFWAISFIAMLVYIPALFRAYREYCVTHDPVPALYVKSDLTGYYGTDENSSRVGESGPKEVEERSEV
jgi:hypothetical protein